LTGTNPTVGALLFADTSGTQTWGINNTGTINLSVTSGSPVISSGGAGTIVVQNNRAPLAGFPPLSTCRFRPFSRLSDSPWQAKVPPSEVGRLPEPPSRLSMNKSSPSA
jgi:hypothetical protein